MVVIRANENSGACAQVRSASFDEIQLEAARGAGGGALLAVPQPGARSRSFDSAGSDDSGTYLEVNYSLNFPFHVPQ